MIILPSCEFHSTNKNKLYTNENIMSKKIYVSIIVLLLSVYVQAQHLTGHFPVYAGQPVGLSGYNGFKSDAFAKDTVDSLGTFVLTYPADYRGVAFLQFGTSGGIEVLLNGETDFSLTGASLQEVDSLQCEGNGPTSRLYTFYKEQQARERALAGWKYLESTYRDVPYFQSSKKEKLLSREISQLEKEKELFIRRQGADSYLGWYLPLVSLVRDIPMSVQRYRERIPEHISFFMHTNFCDERFWCSGLFSLLLDNYYFMIENMGKPQDSMYVEMNRSTDYLLANLLDGKPDWVEEAGIYLFKLFEKRSLFAAAEHLSLSLLDMPGVQLSDDARKRFEGYRAMKKGNQAPDIDFAATTSIATGPATTVFERYLKGHRSLSEIDSKYKLVIFGEAACPDCRRQAQKIKYKYADLQQHGIEVVYLSLDTDIHEFEQVAPNYPWLSYFDGKGWEGKPVLDYHVFASPTIYLLGDDLKILYKVVSPEHLEAILKVLE